MGVLIILDIVPQRIEPCAWADVWDEVRRLLSAHPAELLGHDWITVAGVPLPVYTRSIERGWDDPIARRLCVAGDRAAMSAGPQQTVFRDLDRYLARCPPEAEPRDDILLAAAGVDASRTPPSFPVPTTAPRAHAAHVRDGVVQVLGDEPCTAPCALPLLAAAMVVEARLPRQAMAHGEIDREQAEAARRWAESVLGPERPIALPVRVDAWRLVERLGAELCGPALVRAVDRLHLAAPAKKDAALISIFGHAEADPWWLDKLRLAGRSSGDRAHVDTRRLVASYYEATRDLGRVLGLVCLDPRGPRWSPDGFMEVLATLALDTAAVERALGVVFGSGTERLAAVYRAQVAASARDGAAPSDARDASDTDGNALATLASPADLAASQRDEILAIALAARRTAASDVAQQSDRAALVRAIATSLAEHGPTLSEAAWEWILREDDPEVLRLLAALAASPNAAAPVRRALFENRALCRWASASIRDR